MTPHDSHLYPNQERLGACACFVIGKQNFFEAETQMSAEAEYVSPHRRLRFSRCFTSGMLTEGIHRGKSSGQTRREIYRHGLRAVHLAPCYCVVRYSTSNFQFQVSSVLQESFFRQLASKFDVPELQLPVFKSSIFF